MNLLEAVVNTVWVSSIVLVFVREFMNKSDSWWSYINATFFVGSLIGTSLVMMQTTWFNKNKLAAILVGSTISGLATLAIISWNNSFFILLLSAIIGIASQVKSIPQNTLIQQQVEHDKLIYVYSSLNIVYTAVFSLSILAIGQLVDRLGVQFVFILSGMLLLVVSALVVAKRKLFKEYTI
ncbi:MAG: hypothetical protein ACK5NA_07235 [Enterococcus sp.]